MIFDEWMWRRHLLRGLDLEETDPAEAIVRRSAIRAVPAGSHAGASGRAARAALALELGGEVIGGEA